MVWKKGESGNPSGRPEGLRPKLNEAFLRDLLKHWKEHGSAALDKVFADDPSTYVRVAASLVPRDINIKQHHIIEQLNSLTDHELSARITELGRSLGDTAVVFTVPRDRSTH